MVTTCEMVGLKRILSEHCGKVLGVLTICDITNWDYFTCHENFSQRMKFILPQTSLPCWWGEWVSPYILTLIPEEDKSSYLQSPDWLSNLLGYLQAQNKVWTYMTPNVLTEITKLNIWIKFLIKSFLFSFGHFFMLIGVRGSMKLTIHQSIHQWPASKNSYFLGYAQETAKVSSLSLILYKF